MAQVKTVKNPLTEPQQQLKEKLQDMQNCMRQTGSSHSLNTPTSPGFQLPASPHRHTYIPLRELSSVADKQQPQIDSWQSHLVIFLQTIPKWRQNIRKYCQVSVDKATGKATIIQVDAETIKNFQSQIKIGEKLAREPQQLAQKIFGTNVPKIVQEQAESIVKQLNAELEEYKKAATDNQPSNTKPSP